MYMHRDSLFASFFFIFQAPNIHIHVHALWIFLAPVLRNQLQNSHKELIFIITSWIKPKITNVDNWPNFRNIFQLLVKCFVYLHVGKLSVGSLPKLKHNRFSTKYVIIIITSYKPWEIITIQYVSRSLSYFAR